VVTAISAHDGAVVVDCDDADAAAEEDQSEYVRAVFDYDGAEGHLTLNVGDRVRVVQKHDSGWYSPPSLHLQMLLRNKPDLCVLQVQRRTARQRWLVSC
jgi:hypothetical protein